MVIFFTQVTQPDALRHRGEMRAQRCCSEHIRQVTAPTRDAILKIFRIASITQHLRVIVRFNHQIFCTLHKGNHLICKLTGIGNQTESRQFHTLCSVHFRRFRSNQFNEIAIVVVGIVWHRKRSDAKIPHFKRFIH